jgi:hypothetical protein
MSSFMPAQSAQMSQNPMLPVHPTTAALDSQYAAEEAVLRQQVSQQYADILQQLGYNDAQGNFIPGSVTTNAQRQQADLQRSSDIAAEDTTKNAQQQGTLFSGLRGTEQARAQYPFQQQMLNMAIDVPLQLAHLHEQAAGLADQYTLQNNQLLASAATRAAQAQQQAAALKAQQDATAAMQNQQYNFSYPNFGGGGGGDGGGDQGGGDQGGGAPAQISTAGGPAAALNRPGAVNAMGGPANYAAARQSVQEHPVVAAHKATVNALKSYNPLVGRDF